MVAVIREYLEAHGLADKVVFRGAHCFNRCEEGPVLKIGGREYIRVQAENLPALLEKELKGLVRAE